MRTLYFALLGLALVTAGSAAIFLPILSAPPETAADWCRDVLLVAWGAIIISFGYAVLEYAGRPE